MAENNSRSKGAKAMLDGSFGNLYLYTSNGKTYAHLSGTLGILCLNNSSGINKIKLTRSDGPIGRKSEYTTS